MTDAKALSERIIYTLSLARTNIDTITPLIEVVLLQAKREAFEEAALIADELAERHGFYDGGYEVGRQIAKELRQRAKEGT